jgi:hypothetical protein
MRAAVAAAASVCTGLPAESERDNRQAQASPVAPISPIPVLGQGPSDVEQCGRSIHRRRFRSLPSWCDIYTGLNLKMTHRTSNRGPGIYFTSSHEDTHAE